MVVNAYMGSLRQFLTLSLPGTSHKNKFILIDASTWDINGSNKKDVINMSAKLHNPLSMMYFALRKNFTILKENLSEYTCIILDGTSGWFHFNFKDIDKGAI